MTNEDKILQILEQQGKALEKLQDGQTNLVKTVGSLQDRQEQMSKQLDRIEQDQSHMTTAIEALATKGDVETAVSTAKEEIQGDLLNLGARINRTLHNQETRIKNLEKHTGTTDPTKN